MIDHAREVQRSKDKVSQISKVGGSTMIAKGYTSQDFSKSVASNINEHSQELNNRYLPLKFSKLRDTKNLSLDVRHSSDPYDTNDGQTVDMPVTNQSSNDVVSEVAQKGKKRRIEYKLNVPNIVYEEKSVQLDEEQKQPVVYQQVSYG